jgi:hypothetical protein
MDQSLRKFDIDALFAALDARREQLGLSWHGVAKEIWKLDATLNEKRPSDHPFSASTIKSMRERQRTSCQHALFMLRWLDRAPECFLVDPSPRAGEIHLPQVPPDRRLRWSLKRLHGLLDARREVQGLSWTDTATRLGCKINQLTGLRTAKYATNIELAMRIVQWTGQPSTEFMYLAKW